MIHQKEGEEHLNRQRTLRNVAHFLPAAVWAGIVIVLSLLPGSTTEKWHILKFLHADKIGHVIFYLLFAVFFLHGWSKSGLSHPRGIVIAAAAGVALGLFLELLQGQITETRRFELFDLIANIMGTACGCALFNVLLKKRYYGS